MANIGTSGLHWFARGMAGGFMILAAINALSWFWLSDGWSDLCGATRNANSEAIGFPMEIWREGTFYGSGWMINFPMVAANLVFAMILSVFAGYFALSLRSKLTDLVRKFETDFQSSEATRRITFSVRGLLIVTSLVAVVFGFTGAFGVSPWLLGAIYGLGPLVLILIAMAPTGYRWEQRVVILIVSAVVMLAGCVGVGLALGMEFDRVLFGIFICWVPQSVFASVIVLANSMIRHRIFAQV